MSTIAITDHDTVDGIAQAQRAAGTSLEVLAGVEISADEGHAGGEVHLLGYMIDPTHAGLREALAQGQAARLDRAAEMVTRLRASGAPISWERLVELAGRGTVGRAHIAQALVDAGHVESISEAFERYIGPDGPAYVPRAKLSSAGAIALIRRAGGVPVLAHPWPDLERVPRLVSMGLAGLEVRYPRYSPGLMSILDGLARRYRLLRTGGSDFHGLAIKPDYPLGSVFVSPEWVEALKAWRHAAEGTA